MSYETGLILSCLRHASCACIGESDFVFPTQAGRVYSSDDSIRRGQIERSIPGRRIEPNLGPYTGGKISGAESFG